MSAAGRAVTRIAVVGSGIVGTTVAYVLARGGCEVDVFEKGPDYPYPHRIPFRERYLFNYDDPGYRLASDVQNHTRAGDYPLDLDAERIMVVGGSATKWLAETLRQRPGDFQPRSRYGFAADWPLVYDDLEEDYCRAEALFGVSGTDDDNPFAPRRSRGYPLPAFELSGDDLVLAERLRRHGIVLHSTPQARTRLAYDGRPACMNHGTCVVCPIGARYSPTHHLAHAVATGRCRVHANTSVRRVLFDGAGRARALVYRPNDAPEDGEHGADVIVVAAGAIESARLLLLSSEGPHPDGLRSGHVGRHLVFHHLWWNKLHYREAGLPGSVGAATGRSHQFLDPPARGRHGGIKIEFSADESVLPGALAEATGPEIVDALAEMRHWRVLGLHAESTPSDDKYVALSERRDRFGDPFPHVAYRSAEFDYETHRFGRGLVDRFVAATGADRVESAAPGEYDSAAHHMGTCRMGADARDSVVDAFCRVHGSPNLFVVGGSSFPASSALQPTLTMAALAFRAARYIADQLAPASRPRQQTVR